MTEVKRDFSFSKSCRLLFSKQYRVMSSCSKTYAGASASISIMKHLSLKTPKLGITVTRKYGKAHERNYFKRLSREAFRHIKPELPEWIWIHIRPHKNTKQFLSLSNVQKDVLDSVAKFSSELKTCKQIITD